MANEVTLNASLDYSDSESTVDGLAIIAKQVTVASKKVARVKQAVTTSEVAMKLGDITSLGWVFVINRDATNYVELRVGTGGTKFAKLLPGECAMFRFGSGITAPFIIANVATCQVEYLLISL